MLTLAVLLSLTQAPAMKPGPMTPHQPRSFKPGSPLRPSERLEAWLDRQQGVLRLPVTISADSLGHVTRAMLGDLELKLGDSALGVSLADRIRQHCGPRASDAGTPPCVLRLEGRWVAGQRRFEISWVEGAVKPGEQADQAEVEAR